MLALLVGLVALAGAWLWTASAGGRGFFLAAGGGYAVAVAVIWFQLDRLLANRALNKNALPERPELYDFDKLNPPMHIDEVGGKCLKDLTFVVFDTETTGLATEGADQIISIGGVRIRGCRVLDHEPFTRLIDPKMPITKASTKIHGITDDMVRGEAGVEEVIPAFKEFVGDAVLVAHNAAFDMAFLKKNHAATGVTFDNLVLDTLLLSVFAEAESRNHSLEAMAERLGVNIEGRHTALGDAIATAKVFVRLLDLLETRGVITCRQAINASVKMEQVREMGKEW